MRYEKVGEEADGTPIYHSVKEEGEKEKVKDKGFDEERVKCDEDYLRNLYTRFPGWRSRMNE